MKSFVLILATFSLACAAPQVGQLDFNYDGPSIERLEANGTYPYHPTIGGRIVGGTVASIEELPWQVALLRNGAQICGGIIVAPRVVLTAAHCVVSSVIPAVSLLNIRSGSSLHNSGGLRVAVSRIVVNPNYQDCITCAPDYDIAVLHLAADAVATGVPSAAIRLWEANTVFPAGTYGTTSGWGTTSEGGSGSGTLRRVDVPVVAEANCRQVYGSIISSRTICAGYAAGGKDSCQGDSGGPFVIQGGLAGIVSFGGGCARPGIPGVYASIPAYREWIRTNAGV